MGGSVGGVSGETCPKPEPSRLLLLPLVGKAIPREELLLPERG